MARKQQSNAALMAWLRKQENGEEAYFGNVWAAAVEWADSHPNWIPVEERKPNDGQVVLIYSKGGDVCVTCYKNGAFNCSPLFQAINVTHWMEIQPPQGKEE